MWGIRGFILIMTFVAGYGTGLFVAYQINKRFRNKMEENIKTTFTQKIEELKSQL